MYLLQHPPLSHHCIIIIIIIIVLVIIIQGSENFLCSIADTHVKDLAILFDGSISSTALYRRLTRQVPTLSLGIFGLEQTKRYVAGTHLHLICITISSCIAPAASSQ